jgi:tetratricopeptide (TPR) repeat protein
VTEARRQAATALRIAAITGLILLFLAVSVQKIWSSDTGWQLAVGRWIVRHGRVPSVDEFSFTAQGRPEIEMRWVWCTLLYLGWNIGPWLLCLAQAVILALVWFLIARAGRRAIATPVGLGLLALAMAAGQNRWVMRPELSTYAMLAAFLVFLDSVRNTPPGRAGAWRWVLLPVLQIIWVNTHTLFILGPILCWTFVAAAAGERLIGTRLRASPSPVPRTGAAPLAALALIVTAMCLVNPYFLRGALFTAEIANESGSGSIVAQTIGEMQSPLTIPLSAWTWDLYSGAALAALAAFLLLRDRRRWDLARVAVFLGGLYLACKAQRGLGMFAIMAAWAGLTQAEDDPPRPALVPAFGGIALLCAAAAWYVATDRSAIRVGAPRETGLGVVEWNTPEPTSRFLLGAAPQPQLFNEVRDGGYLAWRADGRFRIFVDGRTDVYGDALMRELDALRPANWSEFADKRGINTAVIPVKGFEELVGRIAANKAWFPVHVDHRDVVFVRDTAANAALIASARIDLNKPWKSPDPEPEQHVEAWKRVIGGRGRPWYTQGMASSFLALGSLVNARPYLERTLRDFPDSPRARAELAAIERFEGHAAEGDRLAVGLDAPWSVYSDRMLATWLQSASRPADLTAALERAVRAGGEDADVRRVLGDQYFQAGDFARAREQYEAAVRLGLDTAPEWLKLAASRERTGDDAGAITAYRRSLDKDPSQAPVWNKLGSMLARRGDRSGAASCFQQALKASPDFEPARRNLEALGGGR